MVAASGFGAGSLSSYEWRDSTWVSPGGYTARFRQLARLGVTDLFVDITRSVTMLKGADPDLGPYLLRFRRLVALGAARGIRVHALAGDPWWGTGDRAGPLDAVAVLARMGRLGEGAMPAGMQFDVEPWSLPGWGPERAAHYDAFVGMVASVADSWQASSLPGSLGFAVPFWFDRDPLTMILGVLAPVAGAHLNVMTYRIHPTGRGGTGEGFAPAVTVARRVAPGVTLLVGQELGPSTPASTTFHGTSWAAWTNNLQVLRSAWARVARFGGVAAHDVEGLLRLHARG